MKLRRGALVGMLAVAVAGIGAWVVVDRQSPQDVLAVASSYGWNDSQDVGYVFTNGIAVQRIIRGPFEIKKVEPVVSGPLTVLGVQARVVQPGGPGVPFTSTAGWPGRSDDKKFAEEYEGFAPAIGFQVAAPPSAGTGDAQDPSLNLAVGYRLTGEGRGVQRGIWVTYTFQGRTGKVFINSYMAVCAPKSVTCQQEDEDGPVRNA